MTFEGEFYSVHEMELAIISPLRPHPPLYIGGGGREVLSVAPGKSMSSA